MAALFFTNHRMSGVSNVFYRWKEAAMRKQEERMREKQRSRGGNKGKGVPPMIDTELANQEAFRGYSGPHQFVDEPSEIPAATSGHHPDMMINDDDHLDILEHLMNSDNHQDEDLRKDH